MLALLALQLSMVELMIQISDIAAEELLTEITQQKNVMDNEDIDPNIHCMCFQSWHHDVLEGGGAEWIFFKCGR